MNKAVLAAPLLLSLAACTGMTNSYLGVSHYPGEGFNNRKAQQYGCDAATVEAQAKENRGAGGIGGSKMPEVGWTACDIFARTGSADRVSTQQTGNVRSEIWYFESLGGSGLVMVVLQPQNNGWVVTSVNTSGS